MAMDRTIYREIKATGGVWSLAILLGAFVAAAMGSVIYVEHHGHIVTGMNNSVVWGLPHVFAIFLIVAASGALNAASIASVFGQAPYKPIARLSAVLAMSLLVGGLAVLVLDLGRPDRLLVAMTTYNFKSIFSWNIYLYTGFLAVVAAYLFVQMSRIDYKYVRIVGTAAFLWRLALTTGTGSIFGWLVARPGYDAAIMAPLFIAMSFSFGLAMFILVLTMLFKLSGRKFGSGLRLRMGNLLALFAAAVLYFTIVQHLTAMYAAEHAGFERFILLEGGHVTFLFWVVQVLIGGILPIALIYLPTIRDSDSEPVWASVFVVIGGLAQVYVIVVGGQLYPMEVFPGYEVTASAFGDGEIASYAPKWSEVVLGLGGVAISLLAVGAAAKFLRILPTNLTEVNVPQD
ncbi:NrfD/PsrC family molybdoenzyme membrane anchor subunit [Alisedimentitalea sp. MJ-SS2]|uniref:NrfD/PsrC family molybdoenzyme membrane anchor subunit n=1 Tax=Aliisedimentitalea sp. MJ-SS2 TaxID=3049795 RepID=UPI0029065CEC|nr:NrfD/PsrC family molybdoenzyme membrane anchor subunit [Alisedimentitalea sp. MJ-SS2]MDU8926202.1 NrfD/PsrC family molybdoenzyme membrane anchor subunit [Alisedimentitalea sp. MJ-SS2]